MKGFPLGDTARSITSEFRRQWTRVEPFGEAGWHMIYEPDRVAIKTSTGEVVAQQDDPRTSFAGHVWETPWTATQLAYFNGYAMWTYYNFPFVLGERGVEIADIPPMAHAGQLLRGMRVRFPRNVYSHCEDQNLYFDDRGLLRRHDYEVEVAGQARAAHLISEYVD
jgi:hypothetical protein